MKFPRLVGALLSVFVLLGLCACKTTTRSSKRYYKPENTGGPLIQACRLGKLNKLEELIAAGVNVNARDEHNQTALNCAVYRGDIEMVKWLLHEGADVNAKGEYPDKTALMEAATWGNVEIAEILLKAGAEVNVQDDLGCTALMWATISNYANPRIIETLLDAGANVNMKDKDGDTALAIAQRAGNKEVVQLLKSAGAKE